MAIETIGERYEVLSRLGAGGMGDVWLADDTVLGRQVALKFVGAQELRESPGAAEILRDEARTAGKLIGHPQIVSVLDLLDVDTDLHKGPAIILEYMDGCNLADWIATRAPQLSDDETRTKIALYIALEVTDAIHTAHKLGILHRDIKPQNILCSLNGRVKVADFGLARVVEAITRTHTVWGRHTPLYAAPEQWEDEKPGEETDVYQLCATLFHLFAGRPANEGQNLIGLMRWQQKGSIKPLSELAPLVPASVADLVMKGLAIKQEARPGLWEIFDALSDSLMVKVRVSVDATSCDEDTIKKIASLTDYEPTAFVANKVWAGTLYPNPLEALREAIGITLLGGIPTIVKA